MPRTPPTSTASTASAWTTRTSTSASPSPASTRPASSPSSIRARKRCWNISSPRPSPKSARPDQAQVSASCPPSDLQGAPAMMPGKASRLAAAGSSISSSSSPSRSWTCRWTPDTIDPKAINVVLLFHPAGITPEAEFAIDQYLLNGGTVVACLDPYSVAAQMAQPAEPDDGRRPPPRPPPRFPPCSAPGASP